MSTYKNRTTPGVYVTELNAFPNSVPGVQTAVPAFIGYTETAVLGGKPAPFTPIPINSMADYQGIFGGDFDPIYDIADADPATADFIAHEKDGKGNFLPKYYMLTRTKAVPNHLLLSRDHGATGQHDEDAASSARARATIGTFLLYNSMRLFYANGGGRCYVVSVGTYTTGGDSPKLTTITKGDLIKGLDAIREQVGPTMLVIPEAVLLSTTNTDFKDVCHEMLKQCHDLQDRVAILDVHGADNLDPASPHFQTEVDECIDAFRGDVDDYLSYGMAYFPFLATSVVPADEVNFTSFNLASKLSRLKEVLTDEVEYLYQGEAGASTRKSVEEQIKKITATDKSNDPAVGKLNQNLVNAIPLLQQIYDTMAAKMSLLPPSGAIAGVYTSNDANRGVWNAPANITLKSVIEPSVKINADLQGPLNSPIDGKSVNVIRDFVGRGPVVMGRPHARRQQQRLALHPGAPHHGLYRAINQNRAQPVRIRAQ